MKKLIENVDYIVVRKSLFGILGSKYRLIKRQEYQSKIKPLKAIDHPYFKLGLDGVVVGEVGYEWDGATGGVDTDNFMRGSLYHDIFCQSIGEGLLPKTYRKAADKMLYDILSEDGMSGFRRTYIYHMIRLYVRIAY